MTNNSRLPAGEVELMPNSDQAYVTYGSMLLKSLKLPGANSPAVKGLGSDADAARPNSSERPDSGSVRPRRSWAERLAGIERPRHRTRASSGQGHERRSRLPRLGIAKFGAQSVAR